MSNESLGFSLIIKSLWSNANYNILGGMIESFTYIQAFLQFIYKKTLGYIFYFFINSNFVIDCLFGGYGSVKTGYNVGYF